MLLPATASLNLDLVLIVANAAFAVGYNQMWQVRLKAVQRLLGIRIFVATSSVDDKPCRVGAMLEPLATEI